PLVAAPQAGRERRGATVAADRPRGGRPPGRARTVRRQITLLVAATTSIVLLAFLLPAASLVARVSEARALDAGRAQLQFLTPSVGLDEREQVAASRAGT